MSRTIGTVLSANSGASVGDALRSVLEYIDCALLLDTGITDGTRRIAEEIVGERLVVESFPWCDDFAQARNFALDAAARQGRAWGAAGGAVWALTLDTDERLEFPGYASREELAAALESDPRVRVWLVMEKGRRYAKERFVRVEDRGREAGAGGQGTGNGRREPGDGELRWVGRVHEALVGAGPGEARVLPGAFFGETPKSPEAFEAKLARDLAILQEETRDKPDDPRWWYYLGQTLAGLKRHAEAVAAFLRCGELPGWDEQAAWALYKAAEAQSELGQFAAAVEACARGLARQAGSPELAWLAGWCCYRQGKIQEAVAWEQMAIALGNVEGCNVEGSGAASSRISFRHLPAWYEGPYDVLRYAYAKLGDRPAAARADAKYREATAERQRDSGSDARSATSGRGFGVGGTPTLGPPPGLRGKKVLLDLGTHHGEGLRKLAPLLGLDSTWEIHCFEPNPECRADRRLRDLPFAVQFHATAAWTRDGTAAFRQENHRDSRSGSPSDGMSDLDGWGSCLAEIESQHAGLAPPIETPCEDLARILGEYADDDYVAVKMDVEGAEFALLRHLLARGVAGRMNVLLVEWHERFVPEETAESRQKLRQRLVDAGVHVLAWG